MWKTCKGRGSCWCTVHLQEPTTFVSEAKSSGRVCWSPRCWLVGVSAQNPPSRTCGQDRNDVAMLPLALGGLGLRSAERTSVPAYWAIWADCMPMIRERHLQVAEWLAATLEGHPDTHHLSEAVAARSLRGSSDSNHHHSQPWQQAPDPRHENQKTMSPGVSWQVGNTRRRHVLRDITVMSRSSHRWRLLGEPLCGLRADPGQDCLSRVAHQSLHVVQPSALQGFAPSAPWFASSSSDLAFLPVCLST